MTLKPVTTLRPLFWFPLLWLCALHAHSVELVLNGSAVYQQLTRDYYLAGLYLPKASDDPGYIFASSTAKRMQMVVRINRWTPRKWSGQWQNNISINNDLNSAPASLQKALMEFTQFPRAELTEGDEIIVDYQPGGNTRVLLNGDQVIESPGTDLFNFLLNTWIGKLAPSREFRHEILHQSNDALRTELTRHKVSSERKGVYAGWIAAEKAQAARARAAEQAAAKARADALAAQREQEQQAQLKARQDEEIRQREDARKREEEARLAAARSESEKQAVARAKALRAAQSEAAKAQAKELVGSTSNALGQRKTAPVLAEEQRYFLELLQWNLQRLTEANVTYPTWARQFGQEGLAQVDFTFSRERKITNLQARDEQVDDLLISELERALAQAAPDVDIPAGLSGEQWPLSASYRFALASDAQESLTMPQAPSSLRTGPLPEAEQEALRQSYREARNQAVARRVDYPAAARILKKKGWVSLEVDVQPDGTVLAVRQPKPSPHRELNDALADALKKAQPFPPLPDGLADRVLTINISYEFRL
ncbi:TonB family protein [Thalassolituus sp. LLYu03]|uniref:TonB family protein n=1 Tax=Thalassolituus sp. LLYu03 TaxID=3421656 RepID=UPI003D29CA38